MMRARLLAVLAAGLLLTITTPPSFGQTLRIAMTASDTPTTTGIPNNGGEGFRFCGFPAFDGLIDRASIFGAAMAEVAHTFG